MEIILVIVAVFAILIIIGKIKGAPDPATMSVEALLGRMHSEGTWIQRYESLPYETQQRAGLKKQYEEKKLYGIELQLELMKRGTDKDQETVIPILQRRIKLMKNGMNEEEAKVQAITEYRTIKLMQSGMSEEEAKSQATKEYLETRNIGESQ